LFVCFGAEVNSRFLPVVMLDLHYGSLAPLFDRLPWHGWISVFDIDVGSVVFGAGYRMLVFWRIGQGLPLWGNSSPWEGFWVFKWGFLWRFYLQEL
jgi:hypothetical protein